MSDLARRTRTAQMQRSQKDLALDAKAAKIQGATRGFAAALADRIGAERFARAAVTVLRTTPKLAQCSDESILGGLFVAAQLGLELGGPRALAYLVPYGTEATLIIGYRGWIELFFRTGLVAKVETIDVREGDYFQRGSDSRTGGRWYEHRAADDDASRDLRGIVAQVVLKDGTVQWDYLTEDEILQRRPSRWTGTPWETWPDEMKRKTVLRHLAKMVRTSTDDLALAQQSDETVQRRIPGLEENAVEHVPVQGITAAPTREQAPLSEQEPLRKATRTPAETMQQMAEGTFPPPPPEDDEEALFEAQSAEEFNRYQDEQGPV